MLHTAHVITLSHPVRLRDKSRLAEVLFKSPPGCPFLKSGYAFTRFKVGNSSKEFLHKFILQDADFSL